MWRVFLGLWEILGICGDPLGGISFRPLPPQGLYPKFPKKSVPVGLLSEMVEMSLFLGIG